MGMAAEFDEKKAGENFSVAVLPNLYERALYVGYSTEEARALVRVRVPAEDDVAIIRHSNVTAVVVHQKNSGKITVAYDPTEEFGDRIDNIRFLEHEHPLGGKVHSGFYSAIAREDEQGQKISDHVKAQVEQFAAGQKEPVSLTLTGFSRGGTLSLATAAEWMQEGMPKNTHLTDIETFGSPPYGNKQFNEAVAQEAKNTGVEMTRVVAGGDPTPQAMTTPNPLSGMYAQEKEAIYLIPGEKPLVNPSEEVVNSQLKALPKKEWHDADVYAELLDAPQAKLPQFSNRRTQHPYRRDFSESELQPVQNSLPAANEDHLSFPRKYR